MEREYPPLTPPPHTQQSFLSLDNSSILFSLYITVTPAETCCRPARCCAAAEAAAAVSLPSEEAAQEATPGPAGRRRRFKLGI